MSSKNGILFYIFKSMLESEFQSRLIKELKETFPDCIVLKNDSGYLQGVPDLLVLNGNKWIALECKKNLKANHQPNQDYYVAKMNDMSYAAFVCPENKQEVMNDIRATFGTKRKTRTSKSK
jgi:hypothetical protein